MKKEEAPDCLPGSRKSGARPEEWPIPPMIPPRSDVREALRSRKVGKGCGCPVDVSDFEKVVYKDIRGWLQESMAWLCKQRGIDPRTKGNCYLVLALMREHAEWRSAWSCYGLFVPYAQLSYKRIAEEVGYRDDPKWTNKRIRSALRAISCTPEEFESGMRKPLLLVRRAHNDSHGGASWANHYALIRPLSEDIGGDTSQSLLRDLVDTESGYFRDSHREDEDESCEATAQGFEQSNELTGVPKAAVFGTRKTVVGSIESLRFGYSQESLEVPKVPLGSSKSASRRFQKSGLQDPIPLTIPLSTPALVSPTPTSLKRGCGALAFGSERRAGERPEARESREGSAGNYDHNSKAGGNTYSRYR